MRIPRVAELFWAFVVVLLVLLLTGAVHVGAQYIPAIDTIKFAAYVTTNVPEVMVGVPKKFGQRTSRAVEDCQLTEKERLTKVCMSVWAVEPKTNVNIDHVWVNCNGTAKETGQIGYFSTKVAKGSLQKCVVDTPPGYGRRLFGAPGAEFQEAISRFTVADGHVLVLIELLKQ